VAINFLDENNEDLNKLKELSEKRKSMRKKSMTLEGGKACLMLDMFMQIEDMGKFATVKIDGETGRKNAPTRKSSRKSGRQPDRTSRTSLGNNRFELVGKASEDAMRSLLSNSSYEHSSYHEEEYESDHATGSVWHVKDNAQQVLHKEA